MTWAEFHLYVRQRLDKLDSSAFKDIQPEQIDFIGKVEAYNYVKTRYKQFDKGEKRIDDLRNSIVRKSLTAIEVAENLSEYTFDIYEGLPVNTKINDSDYFFLLKGKTQSKVKYCGVQYGALVNDRFNTTALFESVYKPVELDKIERMLEDPFNAPTIERPLLTYEADPLAGTTGKIHVYTDGTFTVKKLVIDYLARPIVPENETSLASLSLPEHTHTEVADLVVASILGDIGQYDAYQVKERDIDKKDY